MIKKKYSLVFFSAIILFASDSLYASGIGFSGYYNIGRMDRQYDALVDRPDTTPPDTTDYNISTTSIDKIYGVGLLYDSAVLNENSFNYRLNIGLGKYKISNDNDTINDINSKILAINNSFGFAITQTETYRFWGGPQLNLDLYKGNSKNTSEWDYAGFSLFLGGTLGINYLVYDNFIISLNNSLGGMIGGAVLSDYDNSPVSEYNVGFNGISYQVDLSFIYRL